jgi:hypothetical protein
MMSFYLVLALVVTLSVFAAADQEYCCQYLNEHHPINAVACSPYDCTYMIKGWGSLKLKTKVDSCSSCEPTTLPSDLVEEKSEENLEDTKIPRPESSDSDTWVQCCLYSSRPDYTDTVTYGQEDSSECTKFYEDKLFIGTWWSTNKDDCFFHQSKSSMSAASNSSAIL